ncbi:MAG: type IV pilus modification PilV family protein [Egibacteraceae bacterium]
MMRSIRRRLAAEEGMTLVELMVAMLILAVVFAGMAQTIITSLSALHAAELRTRATALGKEVVEELHGLAWEKTALYTDEVTGATTFDGEDLVLIPPASPRDPEVPVTDETVDRDGITYELSRRVTWFDDPATSEDEDYKRLVALVAWSERGTARSARVEVLRSPSGSEMAGGLGVTFASLANADYNAAAPTFHEDEVEVDSTGANQHRIAGRVIVSDPSLPATVTYIDRSGAPQTVVDARLGAGTQVRDFEIAFSDAELPHGAVIFTATITDGPDTFTASQRIIAVQNPPSIGSLAVTQDGEATPICVDESGSVTSPVHLEVPTDGFGTVDDVTFTWTGDATHSVPVLAPLSVQTPSGALFRIDLMEGTTAFAPGSTDVTVAAGRTTTSAHFAVTLTETFAPIPVVEGC